MALKLNSDPAINAEQVRRLYQQSPIIYVGIIFVMSVVAGYFWGRAPNHIVIGWVLAILILTLARTVMVLRFRRIGPQDAATGNWGLAFAFSSLLSGIMWGAIAFLFLDPGQLETVLLVSMVLTGMCAGSLVPLSSYIPAYFGFCVPALLPLAFVMFREGQGVQLFVGYLVIAFILVVLGYAFVVNRNLADSIRLQFENLDLLENLREQKNIAEKASADKSRFLAATSHDLRQPLHAMDLFLGALDNLIADDEQKQLMLKTRQSSAALQELLNALTDVSRLDAGQVPVSIKPVDLGRLLAGLNDEFQAQAVQQEIELRVRAPMFVVDTDPQLLTRMLRNLVTNAIVHSGAGKILLSARKRADQVRIEIRDNGRGIPSAEQAQIFSEFYQLKNPERDRNKGLGLGLAIVRRLSRLLDHRLELVSMPGRGSCFRLDIALSSHVPAALAENTGSETGDISGLFIFVIEDEADVLEATTRLLRQWGCELLAGDSLQTITRELDALDYPAPDLIICDYRLRDNQNGLEAIRALRQRFEAPIAAVVITGDTDSAIARSALKQECMLLTKPVAADDLRKLIAAISSA